MKWAKKYIKTIVLVSCVLFSSLEYVYSGTKESASLPFKLLGTILESDRTKSIVVIRDLSSTKQGSYKIGEKILGYQIVGIIRGKAILLKEGKITLLELPLGSEVEPITVVSSDKRIIHRSVLAKKIPDLNAAIAQVVPIPYIESGKIIGLKITKLKDKSLIDLAGLEEGDIATRINGERIDSIQKVLDLYHNSKDQEKIDLEIKRGKVIKTLTYYIN